MQVLLTPEKEIELIDKFLQFLKDNRNKKVYASEIEQVLFDEKTQVEGLQQFHGCLTDEDAEVMTNAIKECRKIDYEEW